MKKRMLSFALVLVLVLSLLPVAASAEDGTSGALTYEIHDGKATITACDKDVSGALVIPDTLGGCPVTEIREGGFVNIPGITSVTIPDSVTTLGEYAFNDCENLKKVVMSKNVTVIPDGCFMNCRALAEINLSDSVTAFEDFAFFDCNALAWKTLPQSLETIGSHALSQTAITVLDLPEGVTELGGDAFSGIRSLQRVKIPAGVTELPDALFSGCEALTEVSLPEGLTRIGKYTFAICHSLTSLTLPSTVTEIGERAFFNCWMQLKFTGHAPQIDDAAFSEASILAVYPSGDSTWTKAKRVTADAFQILWVESDPKPVADTARDSSETLSPMKSLNAQRQNYPYAWAQPLNSGLYAEGDLLTRVEYNSADGIVAVEQYNAAGKLQWKKTIQPELPLWGGFYAGKDYNFLVYGQSNMTENNGAEVFRVVRYTKNWHRVDDARIYGGNTSIPFEAGSLRMAQSGDFLYVHTAHQMYHSSDGWNHQKNISFDVYIPTMTVIAASSGGFVSHSFNQFVIADGADVVQLDHGDASPRALKVTRFTGAAGTPRGNYAQSSEVFPIYGKSGENWTGVQVGGFEASDTHYLIAGTSTEQKENGSKVRNLFIGATTKSKLGQSGDTDIRWLTSYKPNSDGSFPVYVSNPQLVKISDHRFLLLWIEAKDSLQSVKGSTLHYVFLNGKGEKDGKVYSVAEIPLSDCRPIVVGNSVVWYVTTSREPIFFRIDLSAPDSLTRTYRGATTIPGDSFSDVRSTDYFAEPVEWAAMAGITSGTTKTTFSPNAPCTRGQMVTFLWRAMGQPEPTTSKNPFRDVKSSDYFYKAVLWAVEKEITAGTSATTFSPAATVTRAQTVTFLWRAAGKPAVNIQTPFTDVPAGQYYEDAALWAYDNRITQGTKINYQNVSPFEPVPYEPAVSFSPGDPCTRAQIVTFLYRYLAK